MTERKKYWEDPEDPIVRTEIKYGSLHGDKVNNFYLFIWDRQLEEWREPTPVEAYFHFQLRQSRRNFDVAKSRLNVVAERLEDLVGLIRKKI